MNSRLYQLRDRVSGMMSSGIMLFYADKAAIRMFADAMSGDSLVSKHPEDYDLMFLGEQDDSGLIVSVSPELVATGASVAEMLDRRALQKANESGSVRGQLSLGEGGAS